MQLPQKLLQLTGPGTTRHGNATTVANMESGAGALDLLGHSLLPALHHMPMGEMWLASNLDASSPGVSQTLNVCWRVSEREAGRRARGMSCRSVCCCRCCSRHKPFHINRIKSRIEMY